MSKMKCTQYEKMKTIGEDPNMCPILNLKHLMVMNMTQRKYDPI